MKPSSAKAKGRKRVCRRCRSDYEPHKPLQKVCDVCRTKCSSCGCSLTSENWDSRGEKSGKQFRCKSCVAEGVRKTPGRKEWQKRYDLLRNYGISLEEFEALSEGGCQICGDADANLVVDHCHETGAVRGALCSPCNMGIGLLKENISIMEAAIVYLNRK